MIKWIERPSTWIKRPTCSTYPDLFARTTSLDFIHMVVKISVKWEAEMSQTQAGRPRSGWPAYKFQRKTEATFHRHIEMMSCVHEKGGCK